MEEWENLKDSQVLALSDDEIQAYIMLECAKSGVPLPRDAGPKPIATADRRDVTVYEFERVLLLDQAEAEELKAWLDEAESRTGYTFGDGPGYRKVLASEGKARYERELMYSPESWEEYGDSANAFDRAVSDWEDEDRECRRNNERRKGIVERIRGRRDSLEKHTNRQNHWLGELQRYADLGLNTMQARAALVLAHPEAADFLPKPDEVNGQKDHKSEFVLEEEQREASRWLGD